MATGVRYLVAHSFYYKRIDIIHSVAVLADIIDCLAELRAIKAEVYPNKILLCHVHNGVRTIHYE